MTDLIDLEMWALKDVEKNIIIRTKWGRSTWTRKPNVKNLPIIMMEYDLKQNKKIYKVLKRINYKKFFFRSKNGLLKEHKNERIFNIFYIHKKTLKEINTEIKIEYNDNN